MNLKSKLFGFSANSILSDSGLAIGVPASWAETEDEYIPVRIITATI